jgi:hypothetical protein
MSCPTPDELALPRFAAHVEACPSCEAALRALEKPLVDVL